MSSCTVIHKEVRATLDSNREISSRTLNVDKDPYRSASKNKKQYLLNISKTPYIFMVSEARIQDKSAYLTSTGTIKDKNLAAAQKDLQESLTKGGVVILSNQEYSKEKPKTRPGIDSYDKGKRFTPTAGIKDMSSEFQSSQNVQFIKRVTINWSCF